MMPNLIFLRGLASILLLIGVARAGNQLPPEIRHVLDSSPSATIYSLEPRDAHPEVGTRLEGFKILGHAHIEGEEMKQAAAEFESAAARGDNQLYNCFDPRHALQIVSDSHTYDFLLCFACHQIVVYRDGIQIAGVGAAGKPDALNKLLRAHHLHISHSGDENSRPNS
jgi:hypothetical protein